MFRFLNQLPLVSGAKPVVAGNPQERDSHIKRNSARNGTERLLPVGKMARIFPQEMADERFRGILVPGILKEEMHQFPGNAARIEQPVRAARPLQIEGPHAKPVAEQKVIRRGVAVNPYLTVLPHFRLFPPAVAQPTEFPRLLTADPVQSRQAAGQAVHIRTGIIEINPAVPRGAVVEPGQKIRQCRQFGIQQSIIPRMDGVQNDIAHQFAFAKLHDQKFVQRKIASERTRDIMGASGKTAVAHHAEIMIFPLHPSRRNLMVADSCRQEKFSDHFRAAVFFFIKIHVIGSVQFKDPIGQMAGIATDLRLNFILEIIIKRIVFRQMPQVLFAHFFSPHLFNRSPDFRNLPHAPPYCKRSSIQKTKEELDELIKLEGWSKARFKILQLLTKLRQICIDPSIIFDNYKGESAKIDELLKIVEETKANGHKMLIFTTYKKALDLIIPKLNNIGISSYYIDGSVSSKKRMELVEKFNNDNTDVFIITLKAGGTGLNLTSATVVIHLDLWWNPQTENQATDRQ